MGGGGGDDGRVGMALEAAVEVVMDEGECWVVAKDVQ